jgi:hypothetical protein
MMAALKEPAADADHSPAMKLAHTIALAAALALIAAPAFAKSKAHRHHRSGGSQIACTVDGCHRIPPNCHPEIGYSPWGTPTGFDIVVCRR